MKRTLILVSLLLIGVMVFTLSVTKPANAWEWQVRRPYLHWLWEGSHANMINSLLITNNDQIVQHNESYVKMHKVYADRDPLLHVYYLRETGTDSVMDVFLMGLKANNLIYLIHTADDNPAAREAAIKELKLLSECVHSEIIQYQFPYWAELLEEGKYPSKKLSHVYVHYTIDIGEYFSNRNGIDRRFYYWMGYMLNDFTVAHLCDSQEWLQEDQMLLENLYSIRQFQRDPRFTMRAWFDLNSMDLSLKDAWDKAQTKVDYMITKYTDRGM